MVNKTLEKMERSELIQLIEIYSKNWLAMDGVWFQSVERKFGMAEAMEHDCNIWEAFTKIEAQKIKEFLKLSIQTWHRWAEKSFTADIICQYQ